MPTAPACVLLTPHTVSGTCGTTLPLALPAARSVQPGPGCTCVGLLEACALTVLFEADVLVNFVDSLVPVVTRKVCETGR